MNLGLSKTVIVWLVLACAMLVLTILLSPAPETIGLCFLAWVGGIATDQVITHLATPKGTIHGQPGEERP